RTYKSSTSVCSTSPRLSRSRRFPCGQLLQPVKKAELRLGLITCSVGTTHTREYFNPYRNQCQLGSAQCARRRRRSPVAPKTRSGAGGGLREVRGGGAWLCRLRLPHTAAAPPRAAAARTALGRRCGRPRLFGAARPPDGAVRWANAGGDTPSSSARTAHHPRSRDVDTTPPSRLLRHAKNRLFGAVPPVRAGCGRA